MPAPPAPASSSTACGRRTTTAPIPKTAPTRRVPPSPAAYINLIPTISLIEHEWIAHGTCTGLNPDAYFGRSAPRSSSFEIPATFAATITPPAIVAPPVILNQFHQDNPGFPRSSFVLSCGNNQLTGIDVCFDKHLNPAACHGIPSCRARTITSPQSTVPNNSHVPPKLRQHLEP